MNSFKKFNERKLLDMPNFFSSLKVCEISENEYQRAINICRKKCGRIS